MTAYWGLRSLGALIAIALPALPALPAQAGAQLSAVSVRGLAFDSLRGNPISGAVVFVLGLGQSAVTDVRGRFRLDSVPHGERTFVVQHALLDSLGIHALTRRALIGDGGTELTLSVPSFRTMWRTACGGEPPADTGFVYGAVRAIDSREPVPDATVRLSWIVTTFDKKIGLRQRRVTAETRTNAVGAYALCGIPRLTWVRMEAETGDRMGGVSLPPSDLPVARRDLLLENADVDSSSFGAISGVILDGDGFAYSDARVTLDDAVETRSGGDGRFVFRDVRPGTRQLEVTSLGMLPIVASVDVYPRERENVLFQMRRVTTLDVIRVIAPTNRARLMAQGIEERRKLGFGYTMDMTELAAYESFGTVLRDLPGTTVERRHGDFNLYVPDGRGGQCTPEVWIDGHRMAMSTLQMIRPKDVTAVELYSRASAVPMEFRRLERYATCGALLVWTNWAFSR